MSKRLKSASLWYPQNLAAAFGIWTLERMAQLRMPMLQGIGAALGSTMYAIYPYRRSVAATNIRLCFPELSEAEHAALVKAHYRSMGIGLFELGAGWWQDWTRLQPFTEIVGIEHLHAVKASGRGALMLTAHFTTLEICGRIVNEHYPFSCLYRRPDQPRIAMAMTAARERHMARVIHRDEMSDLIRALREGEFIWYAPDQSQRIKYSTILPFCGEPAVTNTATARIAKMGKAAIVPFFGYRKPDGHYRVEIGAPREDLLAMTPEEAAAEINLIIEGFVRKAPDQYFWLHRRFKARGPEFPDPYSHT